MISNLHVLSVVCVTDTENKLSIHDRERHIRTGKKRSNDDLEINLNDGLKEQQKKVQCDKSF